MAESSAFTALRGELSHLCVRAEEKCELFGLHSISRVTIIARDPEDPEMAVLVTNEPEIADVARAIEHLACSERVQDGGREPDGGPWRRIVDGAMHASLAWIDAHQKEHGARPRAAQAVRYFRARILKALEEAPHA